MAQVFRLTSGLRAKPGVMSGNPQHTGNHRKVIGFNPGPHPVAQKLKIGAVDGVTVRRKQHRVPFVKFKPKRVSLRNTFR